MTKKQESRSSIRRDPNPVFTVRYRTPHPGPLEMYALAVLAHFGVPDKARVARSSGRGFRRAASRPVDASSLRLGALALRCGLARQAGPHPRLRTTSARHAAHRTATPRETRIPGLYCTKRHRDRVSQSVTAVISAAQHNGRCLDISTVTVTGKERTFPSHRELFHVLPSLRRSISGWLARLCSACFSPSLIAMPERPQHRSTCPVQTLLHSMRFEVGLPAAFLSSMRIFADVLLSPHSMTPASRRRASTRGARGGYASD